MCTLPIRLKHSLLIHSATEAAVLYPASLGLLLSPAEHVGEHVRCPDAPCLLLHGFECECQVEVGCC